MKVISEVILMCCIALTLVSLIVYNVIVHGIHNF
jgi:hypothetical protein